MRHAPVGLTAALALALALAAPARGGTSASAWQQVWLSQEVAKQISATGRAQTMAVLDGGEATAVAQVYADAGKLRLDYQAAHRVWSLIDDGERLIRLDPERKRAMVAPRPAFALDRNLAERNYIARRPAEDRAVIAGRPTRVVEIVPRAGGGAIWRLWLDEKTGFALKRERYAVTGKRISGTEYLEVEFDATASASLFRLPKGWESVGASERRPSLSLDELSRLVGFRVAVPRRLPPGHVSWGRYLSRRGPGSRKMAELRYTDGLRVLSVFQREGGPGPPAPGGGIGRGGRGRGRGPGGGRGRGRPGFGPPTPGAMSIVDQGSQKALRRISGDRVIVVVGDFAVEELVRVSESIR